MLPVLSQRNLKIFHHTILRSGLSGWLSRHAFIIMVFAFFLHACTERTDQQPREAETSGALSTTESTATQGELRVPTEAEVQALLALQDRIVQQPQEAALRRELGENAIAVNAGVVWSVGRGKIPAHAASQNVARNQAEMVARIDASRWAAYLLEWRKNDYATAFGSVQAQVPGGEVVSKFVTDSTCVVLLKTRW